MESTTRNADQQRVLRGTLLGLILLSIIVVAGVYTQMLVESSRRATTRTVDRELLAIRLEDRFQQASSSKLAFLVAGNDWMLNRLDARLSSARSLMDSIRLTLPENERTAEQTRRTLASSTQLLRILDRQRTLLSTPEGIEEVRNMMRDTGYQRVAVEAYNELAELRRAELEALTDYRDRVGRLLRLASIFGILGAIGLAYLFYVIYTGLGPLITNLSAANERLEREQLDKERLIESLQRKNIDLDHFAYIASHDLQEPLRTVNNFIELFEEEYGDQLGEQAKVYFGFLLRATDRMRDLINNLLNFSHIGQEDSRTQVDLGQVVAGVLEALSFRIEELSAEITVKPLPVVSGFPIELFQLFQNLLTNALKFTRPNTAPRITIYCTESTSYYRIAVEDQGIGISEADQLKIFRMFAKINKAGIYSGDGIGLAFCSKIVELHGGALTVDSEPGRGSTFYFSLPRTHDHETKNSPHSPD